MKKKISICYSCSDVMHHEHKTKIGAWLCGKWQAFLFSQLSRLTKRAPDALRAYDMGEVNGVKLTYVKGNVFATPAKRR